MNQQLFDLGVPTGLLYSNHEIEVCILLFCTYRYVCIWHMMIYDWGKLRKCEILSLYKMHVKYPIKTEVAKLDHKSYEEQFRYEN